MLRSYLCWFYVKISLLYNICNTKILMIASVFVLAFASQQFIKSLHMQCVYFIRSLVKTALFLDLLYFSFQVYFWNNDLKIVLDQFQNHSKLIQWYIIFQFLFAGAIAFHSPSLFSHIPVCLRCLVLNKDNNAIQR